MYLLLNKLKKIKINNIVEIYVFSKKSFTTWKSKNILQVCLNKKFWFASYISKRRECSKWRDRLVSQQICQFGKAIYQLIHFVSQNINELRRQLYYRIQKDDAKDFSKKALKDTWTEFQQKTITVIINELKNK